MSWGSVLELSYVYIQSRGVPGRWMDAHNSKNVYFTETTLEYIETSPESAWAKWILRDGGNGKVMLESLRYRGHYLDAHLPMMLKSHDRILPVLKPGPGGQRQMAVITTTTLSLCDIQGAT